MPSGHPCHGRRLLIRGQQATPSGLPGKPTLSVSTGDAIRSIPQPPPGLECNGRPGRGGITFQRGNFRISDSDEPLQRHGPWYPCPSLPSQWSGPCNRVPGRLVSSGDADDRRPAPRACCRTERDNGPAGVLPDAGEKTACGDNHCFRGQTRIFRSMNRDLDAVFSCSLLLQQLKWL